MNMNIAIMVHPSRIQHVKNYMLPRLPGDTQVFVDSMLQGLWWNAKRCHNSFRPEHTHQLVLQDDLTFCKDFVETVYKILEVAPDKIISLYSSQGEATKVVEQGKHWLTRNGISGQAIVMPVSTEQRWQLWYNRNIPNSPTDLGDDIRISMYIHFVEKVCWLPVPTVVQHIGNMSSTLGYNHPGKYSKTFIGEDKSGLGIDWATGFDHPKKLTYTYSKQELEHVGLKV